MSSLRINECIKWLWAASEGFRRPVVFCALTGALNVCVSLFFVFVCKHLIDIATGVSDDSLGTYIGWLAGCMGAQLLLSVIRSRMANRTEIRLRNELHNRRIAMTVRIAAPTETVRITSKPQQLQAMAQRNPALQKLKDEFGLELV